MSTLFSRFEPVYRFLGSRRTALILFLLLGLSLVPGTFAESDFRLNLLSRILAGCMALNLFVCTLLRIRSLPTAVVTIHFGVALTLAGGLLSSAGYIATVNVYEGTSVDTIYRWDLEREVPLGYSLGVGSIDIEYYPIPVKVGVLKGEKKEALFTLRTGEEFSIGGYEVKVDSLDFPFETLKLTVSRDGRLIGLADTEGTVKPAPDFPYAFKLVAYKDPSYKRVAVGLTLTRGAEVAATGITEVNSPFHWNGLAFYNTNLERDRYGSLYAGIQVVDDPGKPVVYAGFIVVVGGALLWMYRKFYDLRTRAPERNNQ